MGIVKAEMERLNQLRQTADDVLVEVGVLASCPHGYLERTYDAEAEKNAYAYATQRWKNNGVDGTREEMTAAIKESLDDHLGRCAECEAIEAR